MTPSAAPPQLAEQWRLTLSNWANAAQHDELLGLAAKHQSFAWLAARYRETARMNVSDPIARTRLAHVQRAAIAIAFAAPVVREAEKPAPMGKLWRFLLCMAVVLVLSITLAAKQIENRPANAQAPQIMEHAR